MLSRIRVAKSAKVVGKVFSIVPTSTLFLFFLAHAHHDAILSSGSYVMTARKGNRDDQPLTRHPTHPLIFIHHHLSVFYQSPFPSPRPIPQSSFITQEDSTQVAKPSGMMLVGSISVTGTLKRRSWRSWRC
jgi:hypothetical protein